MTRKIAEHQPSLFPWAGWWVKFLEADRFLVLTGVRFAADSADHRFKLGGKWATLAVPKAEKKGLYRDATFDPACLDKIASRIEQFAKGTTYAARLTHVASRLRQHETNSMPELIADMRTLVLEMLERDGPKIVTVSEPGDFSLTKTQRNVARVQANTPKPDEPLWYLSGSGGRDYLEETELPDRCIFVTIAKFGALTCSIIGLSRKITTLLASIYFYGHHLNGIQVSGLVISVTAMVMNFMGKSKKGGHGHHTQHTKDEKEHEDEEMQKMLSEYRDEEEEDQDIELTHRK